MKVDPTYTTARGFLSLVVEGKPPSDEVLAMALDKLLMAYHEARDGAPAEGYMEPPQVSFSERYASLSSRFPNLGVYAVVDPTQINIEQSITAGDAIDDLADIVQDLEEVIWRFENVGSDDGLWHFKSLYRMHWGRHLRELSLYLHAKIW